MRKLFAFIITAALLATPVFAAGDEEDPSVSADPSICEHYFELTVLREATCTDKGLEAYSCNKCGLTYTTETPADGEHEYILAETTATCTGDGQDIYVCTRCGDSYAEDAPAAGHVPEDRPASCTHSQTCSACGEILVPATGHAYTYQYDAEQDGAGDFISYGTWQCANCGRTLPATEANALYYYSLPREKTDADDASVTDAAILTDADDASVTDAASSSRENSADPNNTLWIAVSVVALVVILVEAVLLVRSLNRKKVER